MHSSLLSFTCCKLSECTTTSDDSEPTPWSQLQYLHVMIHYHHLSLRLPTHKDTPHLLLRHSPPSLQLPTHKDTPHLLLRHSPPSLRLPTHKDTPHLLLRHSHAQLKISCHGCPQFHLHSYCQPQPLVCNHS